MSTYMVVALDIRDRDAFKAYQRAAVKTFETGGGRVLAAAPAERVEGDEPRQWNVVVEFPSLEKAKAWYNSDAYQAAIPMRNDSAPGANIIFVEGL
jgi:uncharacterized protein (DUF1330 family)